MKTKAILSLFILMIPYSTLGNDDKNDEETRFTTRILQQNPHSVKKEDLHTFTKRQKGQPSSISIFYKEKVNSYDDNKTSKTRSDGK